jgi:hypothetical protein
MTTTAERGPASSARETTTMTVGEFLLRRLREAGVRHAFGVPGDFNDTGARSFVVKSVADLEEALSAPNDRLIFIESVMDPFDAPAAVVKSGNAGADIDYGPRGPQHRGNMLIRPAT